MLFSEPIKPSTDFRIVDNDYIARKIGDLNATPLGVDEDEEFRISLAGAQEKPQAFGLPAANVAIADFKDTRAVERFDRLWTKDRRLLRLPQEDCCQALSVTPTRKYESDEGPGMPAVLDLLKASDDPDTDRRLFLKAQIMFWLLGATDGHAKNFSIFLQPGGRFRLTPLYHVMSVQPAFDASQLRKNQMKFVLAVGDNRHYLVYEIMPRHFVETAAKSGVSSSFVQSIFDELVESADVVINQIMNDLPAGFPQELAESIAGGLRARLRLVDATGVRTAQ